MTSHAVERPLWSRTDFQAIIAKFPKRQRAARDVEGLIEGEPFRL